MALPGNKNARGNSGGKPYSKDNREKAATLKGLVLDKAVKIMQSKSKSIFMMGQRDMVMNKILPTCVPRELDIGNKDNEPFEVLITDEQSKKIAKRIIRGEEPSSEESREKSLN